MEFSNNKDKRNFIQEIRYAELTEVSMTDYPGNYTKCIGSFEIIRYSAAEFVETNPENGSSIEQDLQITLRGQNEEIDIAVTNITGKYLIIMLKYGNGSIKIVGTNDNPVVLNSENSGLPIITKLISKRTSAEPAKYLLV